MSIIFINISENINSIIAVKSKYFSEFSSKYGEDFML